MQNNPDFKNQPVRATGDQKRCERAGCDMRATENGYCPMHQHFGNKGLYDFRRVQIANRLAEIRKHPDSKNLEVELALIRQILEKIVNTCEQDADYLRFSGQIMQMVDKISHLLKTNIQLGQVTHQLLSIEEVIGIAQQIVVIVGDYLDEDALAKVSERIEQVLMGTVVDEQS